MKTTKATTTAVTLWCPSCDEDMPNESGSYMWTYEDLQGKKSVQCFMCGERSRLPKIAKMP